MEVIKGEKLNYRIDHIADSKIRTKKPENLGFHWVLTAQINGEMTLSNPDDVFSYLDLKDESLYCTRLGDSGFAVFYNPDRVLKSDGHRYVIGDVVIAAYDEEDDTIHTLTEYDLMDAVLAFTNRLVQLSIGDMAYKMAIDIDGRTFS